jgi:hypothetical protein
MSKPMALEAAIERAVEKLRPVRLGQRCASLGIPEPEDGKVDVRMFGADARLDVSQWTLTLSSTAEPASPSDFVLLLHYLSCDVPVSPTGELVSFRALPGGQFYFAPFQERTVKPLVERFGNDLDELRARLGRFDHQLTSHGDLGARIHAMGKLHVTLVYHVGDDEFPAGANVLFDSCVKRVFGAEDAAIMAGRICFGLL